MQKKRTLEWLNKAGLDPHMLKEDSSPATAAIKSNLIEHCKARYPHEISHESASTSSTTLSASQLYDILSSYFPNSDFQKLNSYEEFLREIEKK